MTLAGVCSAQTICSVLTLSCLPQTVLCIPQSPQSPFLSKLISPPCVFLSDYKKLSSPSTFHQMHRFCSASSPFPSSFFHSAWLCRDLSRPFRCPRFSASVQQVLCDSFSICRCILDASVGRDELHVFLLLCHL